MSSIDEILVPLWTQSLTFETEVETKTIDVHFTVKGNVNQSILYGNLEDSVRLTDGNTINGVPSDDQFLGQFILVKPESSIESHVIRWINLAVIYNKGLKRIAIN